MANLPASTPVAISDGWDMPAAALGRPSANAEGDKEPQASSLWPAEHCSLRGSSSVAAGGQWWLTCLPVAALRDNAEVMGSQSLRARCRPLPGESRSHRQALMAGGALFVAGQQLSHGW